MTPQPPISNHGQFALDFEGVNTDRSERVSRQLARSTSPWNPEAAIRDRVLDDLNETKASLLAWLRRELKIIYRRRAADSADGSAYVTADDARALLDNDPRVPPAEVLNRNFLGSLFKGSDEWESIGDFHKSRTPGSHANLLRRWRLKKGLS